MAKRNIGLDLLKIYATFLVVLLHVSGFTLLLKGEENYSVPVFCVYLIMEAIAYPAIHLFVMIGSWFMIEKCSPIKRIVNIWSQTWIVTIFGMTAYVLILHKFPYWGGVSCIFPFIGRAYWFVTEYIILIMLAPFLNKGMKQCSDRELLILTTVWGCTISVFSTFLPFFPWSQNDSNIGEFILLYLITGCIKRWNGYGKRIKWVVIWGLSVLALSSSALILHFVAPDHEMFFYRYNSVFVISEAVAVFVLFLPIKVIHEKVQRIIIWVQKGSLAVYLIHMHPLFKEKYTEWKIFDFIKDKNPGIYVAYILITCLFIFGSGTLIGRVISYGGKKIECLVENVLGRLKNYLRKQYGK